MNVMLHSKIIINKNLNDYKKCKYLIFKLVIVIMI